MKFHERAKAWRLKRGLSLEQLSDLTGYSVVAIRQLESGRRFGGASLSEWVMQRYRMACAGAEAQLNGGKFRW